MTKQVINIGTSPDKGNGDPLRTAFDKINQNFTELYNNLGLDGTVFDPLNIDTNLIPKTNNTYDIGSPSKQWRSMYVGLNTLYINNVPISLDENGNLTVDGNSISGFPLNAGQPTLNPPNEHSKNELITLYDFDNTVNGQVNYGIGVEEGHVWHAVDDIVAGFKWYAGENRIFTINGNGTLTFIDSSVQETAYRYSAQPTAPTMTTGALWFNTTDGRLYVNYNNTWVDASPTEIDPNAIRFGQNNEIEMPDGALIQDSGFYAGPGQNAVIGQADGNTQVYTQDVGIGLQTYDGTTYYTWSFDNTGKLHLPAGGDIVDNVGNSVIDPTRITNGGGILSINGGDVQIMPPGGGNAKIYPGNNTSVMTLQGKFSTRVEYNSSWDPVEDPPLSAGYNTLTQIEVSAGGVSVSNVRDTGLGNDYDYTWTFGNNGNLTLPGGTTIESEYGGGPRLVLNGNGNYVDIRDNGTILIGYNSTGSIQIGNPAGGADIEILSKKVRFFEQSVPTHSYGAPGDIQGHVAFDGNYIYYCKQDYVNNSTDIWVRVIWTDTNW